MCFLNIINASVNEHKAILMKSKLNLYYFWSKKRFAYFHDLFNPKKMMDQIILMIIHKILDYILCHHTLTSVTLYAPIFITFTFTLNRNGITSLLPSGRSIRSPHTAIIRTAGAVYTLLDVFYHPARWLSRFMQKNNYFAIARPQLFPAPRILAALLSFTLVISCSISLPSIPCPLFPHRLFAPRRCKEKNAKHLCSHQRCLLSGSIDLPREKSGRPRSLRVPWALTWAFISAGA